MPITRREKEIRRQTARQAKHERTVKRVSQKALMAFANDAARNQKRLKTVARVHEKKLRKVLQRTLMASAFEAGNDALQSIDKIKAASELFEIKDAQSQFESEISRWLRRHAATRAKGIIETFRRWLAKVIADANDEGLGERETGRRIRRGAPKMSRNSAERIARTETHSATQRAAWEAAKASSIDLAKEWGSAEDQRVRETHASVDGTTLLDLDEVFLVGDSDMLYPGDPQGEAKEVINCRCIALYHPVIDGEVLR